MGAESFGAILHIFWKEMGYKSIKCIDKKHLDRFLRFLRQSYRIASPCLDILEIFFHSPEINYLL